MNMQKLSIQLKPQSSKAPKATFLPAPEWPLTITSLMIKDLSFWILQNNLRTGQTETVHYFAKPRKITFN